MIHATRSMGVRFDRILEGFDGPLEKIEGFAVVPDGRVTQLTNTEGFFLGHAANDSFIGVNRLLAANEEVYWLREPVEANGRNYPAGTTYIRAGAQTEARLEELASEVGLTFEAAASEPKSDALMLRSLRIGLWDRYGGSMPSGWTRFLLENFEFPFEVVYPQELDAGNLASTLLHGSSRRIPYHRVFQHRG